ncbi:hypothetical protein PInf_016517 [Phytophthora infestans]|nr:hypothetical protein PInf_016517 [Phytophthora infestans]
MTTTISFERCRSQVQEPPAPIVIHDLERDLEGAQVASVAADKSLDRLRDELQLTQEEVVTNDYVGSPHGGSALGSARGGSTAPDPSSSSPTVALVRLSDERKDANESIEKLSAGRDYALEEFVRMTQARDKRQDKLADTELQRDKAATEWADATRTQTELGSKIRRMSDKLKDAETTSDQLRDQVATVRNQHQQLVLERDRSLSERDMARRRLTLVAVATTDPLPAQTGSHPAANASASQQSLGGVDPSAAKRPRSASPASGVGPSRPHKRTRTSSPASSSTKAKAQVGSVAESDFQVSVAVVPTKSGSETGSATKSSSKTVPLTGSAAVVTSKSGSGSNTGPATKTSSKAVSSTGSTETASSTTGLVASTAVSVSALSGSTAGSSVAVSTVSRPASTGSQLVGSGSGKAKAKRPIPIGCGLSSTEDDEDDGSDWPDGSGPPIRSSWKRTLSAGHASFSYDDGNDDDEDPEDSEEAQVADDALKEDMRRALSQSRSEARRRSHSTPTKQVAGAFGSGDGTSGSVIRIGSDDGLGSDDGDGSPYGGGSTGSASVAASPNSSLTGMLPVAPIGPDTTFISAPETFTADTIEPLSLKKLNRVAIATMKITILFPELPLRTEWIFPREENDMPASGYVDSLVTSSNQHGGIT